MPSQETYIKYRKLKFNLLFKSVYQELTNAEILVKLLFNPKLSFTLCISCSLRYNLKLIFENNYNISALENNSYRVYIKY